MAASTIRLRRLALELARLRKQAGLSQRAVVDQTSISLSTINRAERGRHLLHRHALVTLLNLYDATEADRAALLELHETADRPDLDRIGDGLTGAVPTFMAFEKEAKEILTYQSQVVPGLLQTRRYMEEIEPRGTTSVEKLERVYQARSDRQEKWRKRKTSLDVILDESVLRRQVGSQRVMREQLTHLLSLSEEQHVSIHVLPFENGAILGSFVLLHFADAPAVAYAESVVGSLLVDDAQSVEGVTSVWEQLKESVIDAAPLIRKLIDE